MKSILYPRTLFSLSYRLFARQRAQMREPAPSKNDQDLQFREMVNLCQDYQSLLSLRSESPKNNLRIVKKLAHNEGIKNIRFATYNSRTHFKQLLNTFKSPELLDGKTQIEIFLLCKKFRVDRNRFLEELCSQFLEHKKTLSLIPHDSYFEFISALSFYGVSDFEIQQQLIETAFSRLSEPQQFQDLFMYLRSGCTSEQEQALSDSFQKVTAHGLSFKPQSLVNMMEIEVSQKNPILLKQLIQEIKRNSRKFSAFQILRVMQLCSELGTLGVTFSEVLFEKERLRAAKFFKNPQILIALMEQFYLRNLLTINLGQLLEKNILSSDFTILENDSLTQFFITHSLWFGSIKEKEELPMSAREAKQFLKRHDSLVQFLLKHIIARSEEMKVSTLFQAVETYLERAETHRRSIKRLLFEVLRKVSQRIEEFELSDKKSGRFNKKFESLIRHCAINSVMKEECDQIIRSRF